MKKKDILTDIKPIINILLCNKNIKKLNLSKNCSIKNIETLNDILIQNNIEYLNIEMCYIDIAPIIKGLMRNQSLKYLNISYNFCSNISELGLCLKNIKTLQELKVEALFDYTYYYKVPRCEAFPVPDCLHFRKPNNPIKYSCNTLIPLLSFKSFLINLLDNNNTLIKLNVSRMIANNEDLAVLNELLINNKKLKYLDMYGNWWYYDIINKKSINFHIIKDNLLKYSLKQLNIFTNYIPSERRNEFDDILNFIKEHYKN